MNRYHVDGSLPQNGEIFVFGSNLAGIHGAGAARVAKDSFGAKWGYGIGLMGNSWAIPTKNKDIETLPLNQVYDYILTFVNYTQHTDIPFFVTRVGCGLAGFQDSGIAPLFKDAKNCSFAEQWRPYLEQ
jgi:hypothetical protein